VPLQSPLLHLVIPAHNEARVIEALLDSLLAQDYPRLRITLALDRCTDSTAILARQKIAGDARFEILEIQSCPADWAGKVHAVHQAAQAALTHPLGAPDLIAFADADVAMHPRCISACIGLLTHRQLGFLSVLSTLTSHQWFEKIIQPATSMELIRQFPLLRANGSPARRPFANGQFMLFDAAMYQRCGGHAAVKDELLEDLALARLVKECHGSSGVFIAGDMLSCSMYPTFAAFTRGWKRIYTEAARCKVGRLYRHALTALWMGTLMPLGCVCGAIGAVGLLRSGLPNPALHPMLWGILACAVAALLLMLTGLAIIARVGRQSALFVLAAPLGSVITAWILLCAARELAAGVPVRWAGREYVRMRR
jgi:acyl dehydratase